MCERRREAMYQREHHGSSVPSDRRLMSSQLHAGDAVARDHTRQCEDKNNGDQRARVLARVYRYLLARAAEIEATEKQT